MFRVSKKTLAVGSVLGVAAAFSMASSANAATIDFIDWSQSGSDTVIPTFRVDDGGILAPDFFTVTIDIDPASPDAQVTGIFMDFTSAAFVESDFVSAPPFTDFGTNTNAINGVTTINPLDPFQYAIGFDPKVDVPITFQIDNTNANFTLDDWARVGVRWQAVQCAPNCADGDDEGSDKESSTTVLKQGDNVTEVPLPAALPLFLGAFGWLGFMGWRRRRATA